jgi:hypothetical protein
MANQYKNPSPGKSDGPGKVGVFKGGGKKPYCTTQSPYQKKGK